jgi:hypothetical protein
MRYLTPASEPLGLLFVHIPKNAGTAVVEALGLGPHGHVRACSPEFRRTAAALAARIAPRVPRSFAVVRDPYDRFLSAFRYLRMRRSYWHSDDGSTRYGLLPEHALVGAMRGVDDFADWVMGLFVSGRIDHVHHVSRQVSYTHDPADGYATRLVGEVFRLEDGLDAALGALGAPPPGDAPVPVLNRSSSAAGGDGEGWAHTPRSLGVVETVYRADFEAFGYPTRGRQNIPPAQ